MQSAMGRAIYPAAAAKLPSAEIQDPRLNRTFAVYQKDGAWYQRESQPPVFETEHKLEYAVGSGVNGISFIVRRGDHLFQAPLSYYSRTQSWALSPGYEFADYGFSRPIHTACITCHSGRIRPAAEAGIGCESCHGPGTAHIQRKAPMVNPAKLTPALADDICMNCHQGGDTRVLLPGKQLSDFRPGQPLGRTVAIFKLNAGADKDLLEHHQAMKLSRCFQASKEKLNCLTCHKVHAARTDYRQACNNCHPPAATRAHAGPNGDCIACHMPKRAIEEISHSALTNHRIPARPDSAPPAAAERVQLLNPTAAPLPLKTKMEAYGELSGRDPSLTPIYLDLLEQAAKALPEDPLVLAARGRKALRESAPDALALLTQAYDKGSRTTTTFLDLAEALSRAERLWEAVALLDKGIALEPYSKELQKSRILRLIHLKRYDEARASMQRYLEVFPEDTFMRDLLSKVQPPAR
jgi:hypothetical protein